MDALSVDTTPISLFIHDDEDTPQAFVVDLMRRVFGKSEREALAVVSQVEQQGRAQCGPYPPKIANAVLESALAEVTAAGHRLRITTGLMSGRCDLCGAGEVIEIPIGSRIACLCGACVLAAKRASPEQPDQRFNHVCDALDWHFADVRRAELVTTARDFPAHMRADIQIAVDALLSSPVRFFGVHEDHRYEMLSFSRLMRDGRAAQAIAPPQYQDVDVGDSMPVKCLHNGLWLCRSDGLRFAVLLCFNNDYGRAPMIRIEIAVPRGTDGSALVQHVFSALEEAVSAARSYRGKILSFDMETNYRGRAKGVTVHRLPAVKRAEVILPEATLALLDRNILGFVERRDALRRLGQSTRKGVLLYGPPGTGKTHTIRYLATNLPGHTTLIITAEQVVLLPLYMNLARLLQPAMVVIEDVDLIATDREAMGPCEESLLNGLLNEMDGLKEDADILFVLTTNRPEQLEGALAGRPGRIDQAIEVPLPDEAGRATLVRLYGGKLPLGEDVVAEAARRTEGVSAAFIKELMRRLAQASLARDEGRSVAGADIDEALNDMLFAGGRLNVKLLGGAQQMAGGTK
jgi:ATP-dependent Clp protease adapter protein ClpS